MLTFLAPPAAAGTTALPAGCTAYLTVQGKNCRVSHHFTCAADPAGDQWRVDVGPRGPIFFSRTDGEAQWQELVEPNARRTRRLRGTPADAQSLTTLLGSGHDSFAFVLESAEGVTQVNGFDRLTGRSVTIDGVTLQETAFEFRETRGDGSPVITVRGTEYVSPRWRIFLAGPSEADTGAGFARFDHTPIRFILPGAPGFLSETPIFGCIDQVSAMPETLIPAKE